MPSYEKEDEKEREDRQEAAGGPRHTHLREKPVSEAGVSAELLAAGVSPADDAGEPPSLGLQGVWPQETEDGRHSRDFMTAEDTWLLME